MCSCNIMCIRLSLEIVPLVNLVYNAFYYVQAKDTFSVILLPEAMFQNSTPIYENTHNSTNLWRGINQEVWMLLISSWYPLNLNLIYLLWPVHFPVHVRECFKFCTASYPMFHCSLAIRRLILKRAAGSRFAVGATWPRELRTCAALMAAREREEDNKWTPEEKIQRWVW